jgi:hypothetical protein
MDEDWSHKTVYVMGIQVCKFKLQSYVQHEILQLERVSNFKYPSTS